MARLEYNNLPEEIKNKYKNKEIHKIVKPSQTIISVHLRNKDKITWRKKGKGWIIYGDTLQTIDKNNDLDSE
jgi:hypothetical protein